MSEKTIIVNNFGGGKATDKYSGGYGEFSDSRNFDIFTYPERLFPLPDMVDDSAANSKIGALLTAKNSAGGGYVIGLGVDVAGNNLTTNALWKNGGSAWSQISTKLSLSTLNYDLFCEYLYSSATNTIVTADNDSVALYDVTDAVAPTAFIKSFASNPTTITQGFVHPINNTLFFGYDNYIGKNLNGSWIVDGSSKISPVLTLPSKYTVVSLTKYGNYLAIGCTSYIAGSIYTSGNDASVIFLWDMVSTTWQEVVYWGDNDLKIINNLGGVLVGVSRVAANENAEILIKGYAGGQPEILKRVVANNTPTVTIYPRVNLVYKNKLVFSAKLTEDGVTTHNGLWYLGRNKNGGWSLTLGQFASTDGTDKDVIAATFYLGTLYAVHTAVGTTTRQTTTYTQSSYCESSVNPNMPDTDKVFKKQLVSVSAHYLPLPASGQVVMKYKVDGGDWKTIFTESTDSTTATEMSACSDGEQFTSGRNYEFRLESTGMAQITAFTYKYRVMPTNI